MPAPLLHITYQMPGYTDRFRAPYSAVVTLDAHLPNKGLVCVCIVPFNEFEKADVAAYNSNETAIAAGDTARYYTALLTPCRHDTIARDLYASDDFYPNRTINIVSVCNQARDIHRETIKRGIVKGTSGYFEFERHRHEYASSAERIERKASSRFIFPKHG